MVQLGGNENKLPLSAVPSANNSSQGAINKCSVVEIDGGGGTAWLSDQLWSIDDDWVATDNSNNRILGAFESQPK
jgi:hypothetical protein